MLRRMRWFSWGLLAGFGGSAWLTLQARRARQQLTPGNAARIATQVLADRLDDGARRLKEPAPD